MFPWERLSEGLGRSRGPSGSRRAGFAVLISRWSRVTSPRPSRACGLQVGRYDVRSAMATEDRNTPPSTSTNRPDLVSRADRALRGNVAGVGVTIFSLGNGERCGARDGAGSDSPSRA